MQGFEIRFNVYANDQTEADEATATIKQFVSEMAVQGRAVTARKISDAVRKYKNNYFVTNYFK